MFLFWLSMTILKYTRPCFPVIAAASELRRPVVILVAGYRCRAVAQELAKIKGVDKILLAKQKCYKNFLEGSVTPLLAHYAREFNYFLAPTATFWKNIPASIGWEAECCTN